MACPWFYPVERLGGARSIMPLGDAWAGECRAPGHPAVPDRHVLLDCCNLGYAVSRCPRFPAQDGPDAVRFSIAGHRGNIVSLCCVLEKGYLPFARAGIEFDTGGGCSTPYPDPNVQRQACAYLESYLLRKNSS